MNIHGGLANIVARVLVGFTLLSLAPIGASAQDLSVDWVTVTPTAGVAGDTVTLQARIVNNGPGMVFPIQYGWYLSMDSQITTADMALGEVVTAFDYLYDGGSTVVTRQVTVPVFADPSTPSYFGLILDPLGLSFDGNLENNTGCASFTFAGDPPHGFFDTVGDNYLDVVHLSAAISGADLNVAITFQQPPSSTVSLLMGIDLDQNPLTSGDNTSLAGTEAMVSLVYEEFESVVHLSNDAGTHTLADAVLDGNTLLYSIPLSLLGNDAAMDLFWAVDHAVAATADFDRVPDVGVYATDTKTVVVRRPGDNAIQVSVTDPEEGGYPDIQQLDGRVIGDQLHLTLTYAHSVEVMSIPLLGDGLFVWIDMDSDNRLATGFTNTGKTPPSMGIDYQLRLQIDDLGGIVPELLKDADGDGETEVSAMGLPANDMFMRLAGNQILLKIPLSYLGYGDGAAVLAVSNLDTRDILSGPIDRLPDSGAWDLASGAPIPEQTCLAASREVADPADDSIYGTGGLDNDELVHLSVCPGEAALLFAIVFKTFALSNNGATLIYLDMDRDPTTGWAIDNLAGDTTIGAEYVLRSYWDYNLLKQISDLYRIIPPESSRAVNPFATPTLANRLYLTLPLESIGSPTAPIDVVVRTASWGGGGSWLLLPNDEVPDSGVITVNPMLNGLAADLDRDGDVDGRDLVIFVANSAWTAMAEFADAFGR